MSAQFSINSVIESCESTNDLAKEMGAWGPERAPHGSWISARIQSAGRGRLGRHWKSEAGNLFLSLIVRPVSSANLTWIPLVTAAAVAQTLYRLYPSISVRIKWPNDLWILNGIGPAKVGGILCESVSSKAGTFVVIGLGLNCVHAPENLDQATTCLANEISGAKNQVTAPVTADDVRAPIAQAIADAVGRLDSEGPAALKREYEELAVFQRGAEVFWVGASGAKKSGRVVGLGGYGELKVVGENGVEIPLFSEDVSVRPA